MGLIDVDLIEDLLHSSSVSKGIERTMERMINELEIDNMLIVHYEKEIMQPEIVYEWDSVKNRPVCSLETFVHNIENWYHFDEGDLFVAKAVAVLSSEEREMYQSSGFGAVVEYRMTKHGHHIGYIVIAWNTIRNLTDEQVSELQVLFKLMNEMLIKEFDKEVMGESELRLFNLSTDLTKIMLYMVDENYRIQYVNHYAKETYPNIRVGDLCYKALRGANAPCKDCLLRELEHQKMVEKNMYLSFLEDSFRVGATRVQMQDRHNINILALQGEKDEAFKHHRIQIGKKVIFALQMLYKDMIAVELRRDQFYDLFEANVNNCQSYSMNFVLKWLSKVHLDDRQKFLECFDINFLQNAYMNGEKKKEIDFRYRTHEGEYHCMNGEILFEQNTNKEVMVYILFQDVEQVRSAQIEEYRRMRESLMAAKSSAELKGQVLANISHEIRTPMSGIISMSSVARQVYEDKERLIECLTNIDDYADHMMQVMDSLLETVKVDDDAISIAKQSFQIESFLNRLDVLLRQNIEKKNVEFTVQSFCQYRQVVGDAIRLQQAMHYLINNVLSFTPISGKMHVDAKQVAADTDRVFVRFTIETTGHGITEKMKESLFGFSKEAMKGPVEEAHFDLSLAARVIQLMGGQIGLEENAEATKIYFTIPFGLQEEVQNKPARRKIQTRDIDFSGRRILLAEDSEMGQDALRAVLEVVGFTVDTVENGKKAVIQFVSNPANTYDAVLMDVHMPYMDGREATRCIRISGKEDGDTIPIIGLMANTFDSDIEESLKAGMQAHLAKPVDVDKLYKVLKKMIPLKEEEPS